MSIVKYESLPTTTLTSVAMFDGEVEINDLFYLLPITYLQLNRLYYPKIPTCKVKGAILSMRYKGMNRGFPTDKCFKNSITIDLSMGNKNVSLKLSNKKIQLCGATSEKMGEEAGQIIVNYIKRIEELIRLMHANSTETNHTINWVLEKTKHPIIFEEKQRYIAKPPENFHLNKPYDFPKQVNPTLAKWFILMMSDYPFHEDYSMFLKKFVLTRQSVIVTPHLNLLPIEIKMKNHNFWIPFPIFRQRLYDLFTTLENWVAIYDSSWETAVKLLRLSGEQKVVLNHDEEEERSDQYHTFIIFSTGSVTQSGPRPSEIGIFYEEFNRILLENRSFIEMKTKRVSRRKIRISIDEGNYIMPAQPFETVCAI